MEELPLVGLFVGGAGRRMGGAPKGLLLGLDGRPLLERLISEVSAAAPAASLVLVGDSSAYARFNLRSLPDAPRGVGPLGGLRALLMEACDRGIDSALALSCDLPFISSALLRRLMLEEPGAMALSPRDGDLWSSMTARYAVRALQEVDTALSEHQYALQGLFNRLGENARALPLSEAERAQLRDWDSPEDMTQAL